MKKVLIVASLLAVFVAALGFAPGFVSPALADGSNGCEHGQGNKPGCEEVVVIEDGGDGQQPIGGNAGRVDPCTVSGAADCGNGDHGKGNPTNGSLHANCRAAQGEVDPNCRQPEGETPPSGTPVVFVPAEGNFIPVSGGDDEEASPTVEAGAQDSHKTSAFLRRPGERTALAKVVAVCPQDCCCECQSYNWDWLRLPVWLAVVALIVLAAVSLARFLFKRG